MSNFEVREDPIIRDIPDFPNYQISEFGDVYNKTIGKELIPNKNGSIRLSKNKIRETINIKTLIDEIFNNEKIELSNFVEIIGYPEYMINKQAQIYSKRSRRIIKNYICKNGYYAISLSGKPVYIHRLLAINFINNNNNETQVDHINRIKTDNRIENLRWVNYSQNALNKNVSKLNTSGHTGITYVFDKRSDKHYWHSEISYNNSRKSKNFPYTEEGYQNAINWYQEEKNKILV